LTVERGEDCGGSGARPEAALSLGGTFAALSYPNYRLWFMGQLVSLVGTWMQTTAQGFLVFELTRSPAYLGYVGFATGVPSWLFMLYGGVVADRISRRTLLLATQTSMMVLAFVLAGLTFAHWIQPWHIVALAFGLGVPNAFDAPARQAFVLEMVDRPALPNAIALNSIMFNTATAVGPAAAGVAYAFFGPAWCFTLNGLSFLAVIAALLGMRLGTPPTKPRATSALDDLREGIEFVLGEVRVRTIIGLVTVTSLFGLAFSPLTPAWAVSVLHGDARTNGLLLSARGIGSVLGALLIAVLGQTAPRGILLTAGSFAFPLFVLAFAGVRAVAPALLILVGVGAGFMILANMANVLIQTLVPDALRGRVMGLYALTFFGIMPIGALLAGSVAAWAGEPAAVALGALVSLVTALALWVWVPALRRL
jgi:MFS family permease